MEEKWKKIRVLVGGVFDIFYVGYIYFLKQVKEFGDELVVIVVYDEIVRMQKRREFINLVEDRVEFLRVIRYVDEVYIGMFGMIDMELVKRIDFDVIVIGLDQFFNCEKLKEELRKYGINVEVIWIFYFYKSDRVKMSKII